MGTRNSARQGVDGQMPGFFLSARQGVIVFLFHLTLFSLPPLAAQSAPGAAERESYQKNRFTQPLEWIGDSSAKLYEVIIKEKDTGEEERHHTEADHIWVDLKPGNYRFQVIPITNQGRRGPASEWMDFEVFRALQPEIDNFSPGSINLDKDREFALAIFGKNIDPNPKAKIFLRRIEQDTVPIVPIKTKIDDNGTQAELVFNSSQLVPGSYVIYVKNPCGLETSKGGLIAAHSLPAVLAVPPEPEPASDRVPPDWYIGAAWIPIIPIHGEIKQIFNQEFFSLRGAALRGGIFYRSSKIFNPGVEAAASWFWLTEDTGDTQAEIMMVTGDLNLSARIWLGRAAAFILRAGIGLDWLLPCSYYNPEDNLSYKMEGIAPHWNVGASIFVMPGRHLYAEIGLQYNRNFNPIDLFNPEASGYLRPWLGIGWQF